MNRVKQVKKFKSDSFLNKHDFLNKFTFGIVLFVTTILPLSAKLLSSNTADKSQIVGYYPYMQSIGAELLTEIKDTNSGNTIAHFPWTYSDEGNIKSPTVGSIIHIPDIFCSIPKTETETAKTLPELQAVFPNFSFFDRDLDDCASGITSTMNVEWYLLDGTDPIPENVTWESLNPQRVDEQNIIRVGTEDAKQYQLQHNAIPFNNIPLNLNTLDALKVPEIAVGKRIGFRLIPKSATGTPNEGKPIKVWDLSKYFAQNPPSGVGNIAEENPGFILGVNPVEPDNSTAGGVVNVGHSPYVRSIGAQLASSGEDIGWFEFDGKKTDTYWVDLFVNNLRFSILKPGAILYIPDVFCTFRNEDIVDLSTIPSSAYAPNTSEKLPYYRPLFWIADADADSCRASPDEIQWVITQPKSAEWQAYKDKISKLDVSQLTIEEKAELWKEAQPIWSKVEKWSDIEVINVDLSNNIILPGNSDPKYRFDGVGGNYLSAIRVPELVANLYGAGVGFIYTPKTKTGLPDIGRQIKVPNAISSLWGQMPPNRPASLADAKNLEAIERNESGEGQLIGYYSQLRMMAIGDFYDAIPSPETDYSISSINIDCLLDPKKNPLVDCKRPTARSTGSGNAFSFIGFSAQDLPVVSNLKLDGYIGLNEVLTASYEFTPGDGDNQRFKENNSNYEFAPAGQAYDLIGPLSPFAGSDRKIGLNQFDLPALQADQVGQVMELAVQARDGFFRANNIEIVDTALLPLASQPEVKNVKIIPESTNLQAGTVLNGTYEFIPAQSSLAGQDASVFAWDGTSPPVRPIEASGKVLPYTLDITDIGKTITLTVQARDTQSRTGNSESDSINVTIPVPKVTNLTITSSNESFLYTYTSRLTANYDFDSGIPNDNTDLSEYAWYVDGEQIVAGTTGFNFSSNQLGKTVRFTITPKNSLDRTGEPKSADYVLLESPPTIKNLKIELEEENFQPSYYGLLKATYDFVPGISSNSRDKSLFEWQGTYGNSASIAYAFEPNDIGRTVTIKVTPKDGAGLTSAPQYADFTLAQAPAINNLVINENIVSITEPYEVALSATYDYVPSTSSQPDNNSTYVWSGLSIGEQAGATKDGNVPSINLNRADAGKLITLTVTPRDENLLVGKPESKNILAPNELYPPKIDNLRIENTNTANGQNIFVEDTVKAVYSFTPSSVDPNDASEYVWKIGTKSITGKVSNGSAVTYKTALEDAGQIIYLDMQAYDGLDNQGNSASAQSNSVVITPPQVTDVKITVLLESRNPWNVFVAGSYNYIPGKSANPLSDSTYSWTGISAPIINQPTSGEGAVFIPSISLPITEAGKVLTLTIYPKDRAGITGAEKSATFYIPQKPIVPPMISNLRILDDKGNLASVIAADEILIGDYVFTPGSESPLDRSQYTWTRLSGETSGIVNGDKPTYQIKPIDVGSTISLTVVGFDGAGYRGNIATAEIVKVIKKPQISDLTIAFSATGSAEIVGAYNFIEGISYNTADASEYTWLVSGTPVANGVIATSKQLNGTQGLTVIQDYVGKTIQLRVTPKDKAGISGTTLTSNSLVYYAPQVSNAEISGIAKEGISLTAKYDFTPRTNSENTSLAVWSKNSVIDKTISAALPYPLVAADVGKTIGLSVIAKDGNDIRGNTSTAINVGPVEPNYRPAYVADVEMFYFQDKSVVVSGNKFGGTYKTFNEGSVPGDKSTYEWIADGVLRDSGNVEQNRTIPAYTSSDADIGKIITLKVTARDGNGTAGNQASDSTIKVIQPPRVSNPSIYYAGLTRNDIKVGMFLGGTYTWSTGRAGASDASVVNWYVDDLPILTQTVPSQSFVPAFEVVESYVGKVIKLEITAADTLRTPGGNTVSVSTIPVPSNAPKVQNVKIFADFSQSAMITGEYTYIPGVGNNIADSSEYKWMANRTTVLQSGVLNGTNKVNGVNAYTVKTSDVGKTLELLITPKDAEGRIGEPLYSSNSYVYKAPTVTNVTINSNELAIDGQNLTASYNFVGGSNPRDDSTALWSAGTRNAPSQSAKLPFALVQQDVGAQVNLTVTPVDGNGIVGTPSTALNSVGPVKARPPFVADVAIFYTNGRNPVLVKHSLGGTYSKFTEGSIPGDKSTYEWLSGNTVRKSGSVVQPNRSVPAYEVAPADVGSVITLRITARDGNSNPGNMAEDKTGMVVTPPSVSNLLIEGRLDIGYILTGRYIYKGGVSPDNSDASQYRWYFGGVMEKDWQTVDQPGYQLSRKLVAADMGKTIRFEVQAKDKAGVVGNIDKVDVTPPSLSNLRFETNNFQLGGVLKPLYTFVPGSRGAPQALPQNITAIGVTYKWDNVSQPDTGWQVSSVYGSIANPITLSTTEVGKVVTFTAYPYDTNLDRGGEKSISTSKITAPVTPLFGKDYWLMDVQGPGQFINITQNSAFANLGWPASSTAKQVKYEWVVGTKTLASGTLTKNSTTEYALGGSVALSLYRGKTVCIYLTGITAGGVSGKREQAWCRVVP